MFNKQLKKNIKIIDEEINKLMLKLVETEDVGKRIDIEERIESLTDLRSKLSDDKVSESHAKEIITGAVSLAGIVMILKYEKADIITSKAFGMATKLFRG